jgi:diguanylate cyclase (GGDEF)-like protein/PAS domain S-box-containing protein
VESLLGFAAEEWLADPDLWWRQIHPDDRDMVLAEEEASRDLAPGERDVVEYRMLARDGSIRWIRDEATVVRDGTGGAPAWHGFLIDMTERRNLEDQLKHQAFHDPLTGLANRLLFTDRVANALARSLRGARSPAVLFLDLDDFKNVNDVIGHSAGDTLLRGVAERLVRILRPGDTAARLGGDEFGILLEDVVDPDMAVTVADRILEGLAKPFEVEDRQIFASASIGIAHPTTRREGAEELLRNADVAMYGAKRLGKGRHEIYVPAMHLAVLRRLETVEEIRQGLRRGEFDLRYQPVVQLSDGSVIGFEALARWNHPRLGLVMPSAFIPNAEETGLILELGEFVLGEACRQAVTWRGPTRDQAGPSISVNVSARQFRADSLCRAVETGLAAAGLAPERLTLEITESAVMDDSEASSRRLRELKDLGVRLAIDDFGTGYSSLSYLRRLPIDILKVDKSFIDEIAEGGVAFGLARDIVRIGRTLRLDVVAEGVESASQVEALRRIGCGFAQGFHFAPPRHPDEIAATLLSIERDVPRRAG